jgi:hypothetical protein
MRPTSPTYDLAAHITGDGRRGSPGPSEYSIRSRMGDAPKWTMKGRYAETERPNTAPYRDIGTTVGSGPKIALSSRHRELPGLDTPGPSYVPRRLGEDAQKNSLHARVSHARDLRLDNPGPGTYDYSPRFATDSQKYTLKSRVGIPAESVSPGPAAYSPDYRKTKAAAPSATLHIRPEQRQGEATPGPSDYSISRDMTGQRSTMHIRPRGVSVDNVPGPGAYTPTSANKRRNPSYTLKSRQETTEHPNTAPYRDIGSTVGEGPKIALSSRHRELSGMNTPGPGYVPPSLGSDGQKNSLHVRVSGSRDPRADNPGPGAYDYSPRFATDSQKYTLKSRVGIPAESVSPGPAAYSPDYRKTKTAAPSATLHIRPAARRLDETPGYVDLPSTLGGPKWVIGGRDTLDVMPL